jgi:hypothetical protein
MNYDINKSGVHIAQPAPVSAMPKNKGIKKEAPNTNDFRHLKGPLKFAPDTNAFRHKIRSEQSVDWGFSDGANIRKEYVFSLNNNKKISKGTIGLPKQFLRYCLEHGKTEEMFFYLHLNIIASDQAGWVTKAQSRVLYRKLGYSRSKYYRLMNSMANHGMVTIDNKNIHVTAKKKLDCVTNHGSLSIPILCLDVKQHTLAYAVAYYAYRLEKFFRRQFRHNDETYVVKWDKGIPQEILAQSLRTSQATISRILMFESPFFKKQKNYLYQGKTTTKPMHENFSFPAIIKSYKKDYSIYQRYGNSYYPYLSSVSTFFNSNDAILSKVKKWKGKSLRDLIL